MYVQKLALCTLLSVQIPVLIGLPSRGRHLSTSSCRRVLHNSRFLFCPSSTFLRSSSCFLCCSFSASRLASLWRFFSSSMRAKWGKASMASGTSAAARPRSVAIASPKVEDLGWHSSAGLSCSKDRAITQSSALRAGLASPPSPFSKCLAAAYRRGARPPYRVASTICFSSSTPSSSVSPTSSKSNWESSSHSSSENSSSSLSEKSSKSLSKGRNRPGIRIFWRKRSRSSRCSCLFSSRRASRRASTSASRRAASARMSCSASSSPIPSGSFVDRTGSPQPPRRPRHPGQPRHMGPQGPESPATGPLTSVLVWCTALWWGSAAPEALTRTAMVGPSTELSVPCHQPSHSLDNVPRRSLPCLR
mmetsp:Transcript_24556/g.54688  ORF Transcript_24556/g.54688 Transcript_24556/m.54688 type:complete len:362 (-) Transcript_24556:763-1848(-)